MIVSWMKPNCVNTKLSVYVIINVNPVDIIISLWPADLPERYVADKGRSSIFPGRGEIYDYREYFSEKHEKIFSQKLKIFLRKFWRPLPYSFRPLRQ